jgi:uncharacterized membrane protein YfcA
MPELLTPETAGLLLLVGATAGFVDAIAGGGGLLALPTLLSLGLSPAHALATNKLQGSFGTASAGLHFVREGHVDLRRLVPAIAFTFAGAAAGSLSVQFADPSLVSALIPWLLVGAALYFLFSPRPGDVDRHRRLGEGPFALIVGLGIGFYDGFFGPGTGSFFMIAIVALLGHNLRRATGETKVLNFTSNSAALLVFVLGGKVVWSVGLIMGAGQWFGARLGSGVVIRRGAAVVRPLLVIVCLAITAKLVFSGGS